MATLNKEIILETLDKNKAKIKAFGVKKLILFGSYAKDKQSKVSDIDFLVEFEENRGLFRDFFGLKQLLEDIFNKNIDLVEKDYIREELKPFILKGDLYETKV